MADLKTTARRLAIYTAAMAVWAGPLVAAESPEIYASSAAILCPTISALIDGVAADRAGDRKWFESLQCTTLPGGTKAVVIARSGEAYRIRAYREGEGQTGYVLSTDLRVAAAPGDLFVVANTNLFRQPALSDSPIGQIKGGTKISAIEQDAERRWTKVATPAGADGWVQTAMLGNKPPAVRNKLDQKREASRDVASLFQGSSSVPPARLILEKDPVALERFVLDRIEPCLQMDPGAMPSNLRSRINVTVRVNAGGTAELVTARPVVDDRQGRAQADQVRRAIMNPQCNRLLPPGEPSEISLTVSAEMFR